jgi:alkylglycerol monooxygenase
METNIYAIFTIPILFLIIGEIAYCYFKKKPYYTYQDSISSLGTAIINQCTNLIVSLFFFPTYKFLNELWGTNLPNTWWSMLLLFLGVDFLFYWFHRMGHTINILWAAHMPHHSTEELNYAVALRASVTQRAASFFFYWPLTFFWSADLILPMVAFHLVLQLIPHTRVVPKLPKFIESWMNTPSHHRVHHACNKQYRNTNFAGFIILWDRMFGSYVEEVEEPYYGVTTHPGTWDPTVINFQWWGYLFKDMLATKSWWDKIRLWFMPIGWRPADLPPRNVVVKPDGTAQTQKKFKTQDFPFLRSYLVGQIVFGMGIMLFVIWQDSPLSFYEKMLMSGFLWFSATLWSAMLESKSWALKLEPVKTIISGMLLSYFCYIYYPNNEQIIGALAVCHLSVLVWFQLAVRGKATESAMSRS